MALYLTHVAHETEMNADTLEQEDKVTSGKQSGDGNENEDRQSNWKKVN